MKAILIDPASRIVSEVQIEPTVAGINKAIGSETFCIATYLPNTDCVYGDDEGMFVEERHFTAIQAREDTENPAVFVGKLLVVGTDTDNGESIDAKSTSKEIMERVHFLTEREAEEIAEKYNL